MSARGRVILVFVLLAAAAGSSRAEPAPVPFVQPPVPPAAPMEVRPAPGSDVSVATMVPPSKKARILADKAVAAGPESRHDAAQKAWQEALDARIGKPPEPVINLYNTWTHEVLPVSGAKGREAETLSADQVNRFLRCHFTNEPAVMEPRLGATLVAAARHFGVNRIDIVSGFRSPKYNLILRKKGHEVARDSQHTKGHAVDFRLPGVSVKRIHAWARRLGLGGVGFYPSSGFIHIDTGRIRYWNGR